MHHLNATAPTLCNLQTLSIWSQEFQHPQTTTVSLPLYQCNSNIARQQKALVRIVCREGGGGVAFEPLFPKWFS